VAAVCLTAEPHHSPPHLGAWSSD